MEPVYSTKFDKNAVVSEGEVSGKDASNEESYSDEFEDEDPDDDFNLPSGHKQNNEPFERNSNLKREI